VYLLQEIVQPKDLTKNVNPESYKILYRNLIMTFYEKIISVGNRPGPRHQAIGPRWATAQSNLVYLKWLCLIKDNHTYYLKIKSYWTCRIGTDRGPTRPD